MKKAMAIFFAVVIVATISAPIFAYSSPWLWNNSSTFLIGADGKYLGNFGNEYDSNSIFNPYGKYGSKYSSDSIWNQYGKYGNPYSSYSPFNQYSTSPPYVIGPNGYVGRFSVNPYIYDSVIW